MKILKLMLMIVTGPHRWQVNIGPGNSLVPLGNGFYLGQC